MLLWVIFYSFFVLKLQIVDKLPKIVDEIYIFLCKIMVS